MDQHIFLLFALCFLQLALSNKKEGEACNGSAGVCKKVSNCPSAQNDVRNMRLPQSAFCTFDKTDPIVCCPNSSQGSQEGTMKLACEQNAGNGSRKKRQESEFYSIQGGSKAAKSEYPHMAAVGFLRKQRTLWLCGGSLIHKRFVLTAAHCLLDTSSNNAGKPRLVRLGDLDLKSDQDDVDAQMFDVIKRIPHKDYVQTKQYHDIALLKLNKDAVFDNFVKPACLHTQHVIMSPDVIATGWGKDPTVFQTGKNLMSVTLRIQPLAKCQEALKTQDPKILQQALSEGLKDDSMLCVGIDEGGKDTCPGDSGGPIQVKANSPKCEYDVVGVVSFGVGDWSGLKCAQPNTPAVYTRVSNYVPWIESVVCAES